MTFAEALTRLPAARKLNPPRSREPGGPDRCWPDHCSHYAIEGEPGHFRWEGTAAAEQLAEGPGTGPNGEYRAFALVGRGRGCPTLFQRLPGY